MLPSTIVLFGEAGKGAFNTPYFCQNLSQLVDFLGHPPGDSKGIYFAVQTLLFQHDLIFLRVREEGFSFDDYLNGMRVLTQENWITKIAAIYLPGVGSPSILDEVTLLFQDHEKLLIMNEADLFDYLLT